MTRKSLQQQGVPIPDRLGNGSSNRIVAQRNRTSRGSTTRPYSSPSTQSYGTRQSRNSRLSDYNPATLGANAAPSNGGVGGLEGEFLIAIVLLIGLMFSSSAGYQDKIMSLMKRGTLTCVLFFILALIAGIGPNMSKVARAFGALIIVGILVTSPVNTVLNDVDGLIKNDWVGTSESGKTGTADTGTQQSTNGSPASGLIGDLDNLASTADGQAWLKKVLGNKDADNIIKTVASDASKLPGIVDGQDLLSKLAGALGFHL